MDDEEEYLPSSAHHLPDLNTTSSVMDTLPTAETLTLTQLKDQLAQKQREIYNYKATIKNLEEDVKNLYVELVAQKMDSDSWKKQCGELKARVSLLEKGKKQSGVIEILDSEEDDKLKPTENSNEENSDDFGLTTPALKRKRALTMVTSDSEDEFPACKAKTVRVNEETYEENENVGGDEHDDDYDNVPIGKLREIRRLKDTNGDPGEKTPFLRRLVKIGECSAVKDCTTNRMNMEKQSAVRQRLVFVDDSEDAEEKGMDDVDSDSMDGFIASGSESNNWESDKESREESSSDSSEEDLASDVDLDDVLATFRRKKNTEKWEYEADMLASFAEDPELCFKAVCTLYRRQTSEERSVKGTIVHNKQGFNQIDAFKASTIAEFLLDGNPYGPIMKSVREFEKKYPHGLEYCRKIAERYSKQLFTIYQQGEDPFFRPS